MAFNTNTAPAAAASNDAWKAQGFLNFYLPAKDGKKRKLGAIPLKTSKVNEKQLIEWLQEDPTRVEQILGKLIIEFQCADGSDAHAFDLG